MTSVSLNLSSWRPRDLLRFTRLFVFVPLTSLSLTLRYILTYGSLAATRAADRCTTADPLVLPPRAGGLKTIPRRMPPDTALAVRTLSCPHERTDTRLDEESDLASPP
jgi:hypothetical protein